MRKIRTYKDVQDPDADILEQVQAQNARLTRRLERVRRIVAIASGKGGVGKSAITANLAALLASRGHRVGAVDADLNGPSLARMLGADGSRLVVEGDGVRPAEGAAGVAVVSMDLLLSAEDAPLQWRGSNSLSHSIMETGALREFLADVAWGELDWLLVDTPPGTDKLERLLGLVPDPAAVLLVTTPSDAARHVVAKSVRQARDAGVAKIGLVANMTAHVCEKCGHEQPLYTADGARRLGDDAGAELWAEIPFEAALARTTDAGTPLALADDGSPAGRALRRLAERLELETAGDASSEVQPGAVARGETRTVQPEDAER